MEWLVGVATGLIVAAILVALNWLRRRYVNPVVWRLEHTDGDTWRLARGYSRDALAVTLDNPGYHERPVRVQGTTNFVGPPYEDILRGASANWSNIISGCNYTIVWAEKTQWRSVKVSIVGPMHPIEIRQRDAGRLQRSY